MRVLIAGMTPQSTTAVELIVGSVLPSAMLVRQHRGPPTLDELATAARRCELCVVDLLGYGLVTWTREREQSLRDALPPGVRAVLLVAPGTDGARWQEAMQADGGSSRVILPHPASMTQMRTALKTLKEDAARSTSAGDAPSAASARAAGPRPRPGVFGRAAALAAGVAAAVAPRAAGRSAAHGFASTMSYQDAPDPAPARPAATPPPKARAPVAAAASAGLDIDLGAGTRVDPALAGGSAPRRSVAGRDALDFRPDDPDPPTVPGVAGRQRPDTVPDPQPAPASPGSTSPPAVAAPRRAAVADGGQASAARPGPDQPRPGERVEPFALGAESRRVLVAACPQLADNPFLDLVFNVALRPVPCEFRIGSQSGAVFHPRENWVASSISTALRKRLTQHRMMLQIVEVRELAEADAPARAQAYYGRREDGLRPLDAFVWSLVYNTFEDDPPLVGGDFEFRLRRFPNFARLPAAPDLFLQAALLCMRYPQSMDGLRRSYPRQDPRQLSLFVLCSVLSGMAEVRPRVESAEAAPAPAAPAKAAAPKAGFIRSLLAKLF